MTAPDLFTGQLDADGNRTLSAAGCAAVVDVVNSYIRHGVPVGDSLVWLSPDGLGDNHDDARCPPNMRRFLLKFRHDGVRVCAYISALETPARTLVLVPREHLLAGVADIEAALSTVDAYAADMASPSARRTLLTAFTAQDAGNLRHAEREANANCDVLRELPENPRLWQTIAPDAEVRVSMWIEKEPHA